MKHRFVATVSVYVWSDEEDFDQAKKEAYSEANRLADSINVDSPSCEASIYKFYSVPFGSTNINEIEIDERG